MKRAKILFLTVFIVVSFFNVRSISAEIKENLLINGGFENIGVNNKIEGWRIFEWKLAEDTFIDIDKTFTHEGRNSLKLTNNSPKNSVGLQSNNMTVDGGKHYALEGYGRAYGGDGRIYIKFTDAQGKPAGETSQALSPNSKEDKAWKKIQIDIKAPENAANAYILLYIGGSVIGEAWFDNFQFGEYFEKQIMPEVQYGEPVLLGEPVEASMTQSGTFMNIDGIIYHFVAISGAPARFYMIDYTNKKIVHETNVPGSNAVWGTHVAKNGKVYVGGTETGGVFEFDPITYQFIEIGKLPKNHKHVWDIKDDGENLYIGTSLNKQTGGVFKYNFESKVMSEFVYAPNKVEYVRGLGVNDDYVYAGIGGELGQVLRVDKKTMEQKLIDISFKDLKTPVMFSEVSFAKGKLIISSGILLVIMDETTLEVEGVHRFDGRASTVSPLDNDSIYFKDDKGIFTKYSIEHKSFEQLSKKDELPLRNFRTANWIKDENHDDVLMLMTTHAETFKFNPKNNKIEKIEMNLPTNSVIISAMEVANNGTLYLGGYMTGMAAYDTVNNKKSLNIDLFHQPEGIGFLNDEVYFGTYGGAVMYSYNPDKPLDYQEFTSGNPGKLFQIMEAQDRPFAIHGKGDNLYIGTYPTYGQLGGALTVYNTKTDEVNTYRNILPNQSIIGIDSNDKYLYLSTSAEGGLGQSGAVEKATVSILDLETLEIIKTVTPKIENDNNPTFIGSIALGPDGNLWAVTLKDGLVFAMDPETLEVVKSVKTFEGSYVAPGFRPYALKFGTDNRLYTTASKRVSVIDIDTLEFKRFPTGTVLTGTVDEIGNIYYSEGNKLFKLPIISEGLTIDSKENYTVNNVVELDIALKNHYFNNGEISKKLDLNHFEVLLQDDGVLEIEKGKIFAKKEGKTTIQLKYATFESNIIELTIEKEEEIVIPDDKPVIPDDKPIVPDDKPVVPDDKPIVPDDKPVVPDDKPVVPDDKPVDLDDKPVIPNDSSMTPNNDKSSSKLEVTQEINTSNKKPDGKLPQAGVPTSLTIPGISSIFLVVGVILKRKNK